MPLKEDQHGLSLKKEQRVEVMEQLDTGRWFIRATTITGQVEHGWVPSSILELLPPPTTNEDEADGPSLSQDELGSDQSTRRHTTTFDNYDISHQVSVRGRILIIIILCIVTVCIVRSVNVLFLLAL